MSYMKVEPGKHTQKVLICSLAAAVTVLSAALVVAIGFAGFFGNANARPYASALFTCATPKPVPIDPALYSASSTHALRKALDVAVTAVDEYMKVFEKQLAGVAVGIVYDQQVLLSRGFGRANLATTDDSGRVTADTLFAIGSNSKVFTALLLFRLRDMGLLELDDPVTKFIPHFEMKALFPGISNGRDITLRQLASHLSGLPRHSPCDAFRDNCNFTTAEMVERLKNSYLVMPEDDRPSYSNLGFALLGNVISDHASKVIGTGTESFATMLKRIVLDPIGLHSTGVHYTPDVMQRLAVGYSNGANGSLASMSPPLFGWDAPSGQLYSSVNDVLRLMSSLFNTDNSTAGVSALFKATTTRELFLPTHAETTGRYTTGWPWESSLFSPATMPSSPLADAVARLVDLTVPLSNYWLRIKSGMVFGYSSYTVYVPELKLGVVALQNSDLGSVGTLATQIAQIMTPIIDQTLRKLAPAPTLPDDIARFTGRWTTPGVVMQISKRENRDTLLLQVTEAPYNVFKMTVELVYVPGSSFMFSLRSPRNTVVCGELNSGYYEQLAIFSEDVTSLEIPSILYGWKFTRPS